MQRGAPGRGEEPERRPVADPPSLPVFVFPPALDFYADEQSSHKQVLTLYNPFPRVLRYKVLSTAPLRYTVVDAEGLVKPNSCIDIVTRHRDIRARLYGTTDRFRVEVWEEGGARGVIGRKDITAALHAARPQARAAPDAAQWRPPSHLFSMRQGSPRPLSPGLFSLYVLVGLTALLVLLLPLHGDPRSLLHDHLHVSVVQKLVAAYVLGLLTMVFLQADGWMIRGKECDLSLKLRAGYGISALQPITTGGGHLLGLAADTRDSWIVSSVDNREQRLQSM